MTKGAVTLSAACVTRSLAAKSCDSIPNLQKSALPFSQDNLRPNSYSSPTASPSSSSSSSSHSHSPVSLFPSQAPMSRLTTATAVPPTSPSACGVPAGAPAIRIPSVTLSTGTSHTTPASVSPWPAWYLPHDLKKQEVIAVIAGCVSCFCLRKNCVYSGLN